jgi:RNA polymerase sigma-70 factor (ECF subfamily)
MQPIDEVAVVRQAIAGQRFAQGELARLAFPRIMACCLSRVHRQADAEELAQETLLRALQRLSSLEHPERWMAWIRGIAIHVCLDWIRKTHGRLESELAQDPCEEHSLPDQIVANREERHLVLKEVHQLPEELREVLILHYFDSMTYEQMADWLNVARATVSERLSRARQVLRSRLSRSGSVQI